MKLTHSIVAIAALSTLSFAGGDINPVTVFDTEPAVEIPVEPAYTLPVVEETPVYVAPVVQAPVIQAPVVQAPVVQTPVIETPVAAVPVIAAAAAPLGLYIGGGFTDVAVRNSGTANFFSSKAGQKRQVGITGRLGYDFMDYLGAELRGTYGIAKVGDNRFKQIGAYLKPNYNVTDAINLYGLLGASKSNHASLGANSSDTGFSYGAGLDYGISDKFSLFTDVVNYMKKSNTPSEWGLTLGAAYQF